MSYYQDLEGEITQLKEFAEPLMDEVKVTPLMPVINRIINLKDRLLGLSEGELQYVQAEVAECKRLLDDISYEYIKQIITKPIPSDVFEVLSSGTKFEKALRGAMGEKVSTGKGGPDVTVTPELVEALTRYRFSLGTPPVTPKGIQTVEQIVFGGTLQNIYAFRDLIHCDKGVFDRFLGAVDRLNEQSTHYTTEAEKRDFKKRAIEFPNLEGARGLTKALVSGTSETALRLIREQLFSKHVNGNCPVRVMEESQPFTPRLMQEMKADKRSMFIVKASSIPHNIFTDDVLKEEWKGLIGRLVVIDHSDAAKRSGTVLVYSLIPEVTKYLEQFHVKDSGTPANTQMNFRLILENFKNGDIDQLIESVDRKAALLEAEGVHTLPHGDVRKKEWQKTAQLDHVNLKKFKRFLEFVKKMKSGDFSEIEESNRHLAKRTGELAMDYFFKNLKGKGYRAITVPQGGGRREIGLPGRFHLKGHNRKVADFKEQKLQACREKLLALKRDQGIPEGTTAAEAAALERALDARRSPQLPPEGEAASRIGAHVKTRVTEVLHESALRSDAVINRVIARMDEAFGVNIPGLLKEKVTQLLREKGIEAAAKMLERGRFRAAANHLRAFEGRIRVEAARFAEKIKEPLESTRSRLEAADLDFVERLLNDIENKSFEPSLALSEVSWTVGDVLREEDFPKKNFIKIELNVNGSQNPDSFERQLEEKRRALAEFPELFELYCSSILIYFNDPHNPTSQVATPEVKLKLLDLASRYNLAILADEPYHKQVSKKVKDRQGDSPFAEFYEQNRARFPNPVCIYSSISTTKWAMGAGRRTGVLLTNDHSVMEDGKNFEDFVAENIDGCNAMSLYMDLETLLAGLLVKRNCKEIELKTVLLNPSNPYEDSCALIDSILNENFSDLNAEDFNGSLYSLLLNARNTLDRLQARGAEPHDYRQFLSQLVSKLKDFRLDKQTQKDSAQRSQAAWNAVQRLSTEFPGLEERCIEPQGPFYFLVGLDQTENDPALRPFLLALARARKIEIVPQAKGYARFAFGGLVDGTEEGYKDFSLGIETDLRLLLKYWDEFQTIRARLNHEEDLDPINNALKELFPGGEIDLARTIQDKGVLLDHLRSRPRTGKDRLTNPFSPAGSQYMSSIEPGSPATIVTIRDVQCRTAEDFINSEAFRDLFNIFLLQVKGQISGLEQMEDSNIIAQYGADEFAKRFKSRNFQNVRRDIFEEVAIRVAHLWFDPSMIKILGLKIPDGLSASDQGDLLRGAEGRISDFIQTIIQAFVTPEKEAQVLQERIERVIKGLHAKLPQEDRDKLLACSRDYELFSAFLNSLDGSLVPPHTKEMLLALTRNVSYPPCFQAAYPTVRGIKADPCLQEWVQKFIGRSEFAGQSVATDRSPAMVTPGATRVAGYERGIYRRDGDGTTAPGKEFFRKRFGEFVEVMNPKDYVCKMVQVGPTRLMLVMHRSYSHYMVEELRLFPQFDVSLEEMQKLKPDAISFMGIPAKTIGEDYRIGYFLDEDSAGTSIPVSWVDAENITDYMGYLKKPVLTVANERVKAIGGMPVHGSALTITAKNGLRKTVVMGGDSGTGKSETIIAMTNQIIKGLGGAKNIESVELLSGDMLSLFEGEDGEMYMMGTESGDFMRLTDIPNEWQERMRDWINSSSKTNLDDKTNPRATINGICDPNVFLSPVRVNIFANINNFEKPDGAAFQEERNPTNLLLDTYVKGYRREKGTSGDQPNLFASTLHSKVPDRDLLLTKYQEDFDKLLGWDLILAKTGKVKTSILSFKDVPGEVFRARQMVKDLFVGKHCDDKHTILGARYEVRENRFYVTVKEEDTGATEEKLLDRNIFNGVYNPIASTYGGNPFVDPRGMDAVLRRFAEVMKKGGVITGNLYTELATKGEERSGPARAAQALIDFIEEDPRINERFQRNKDRVSRALIAKYGAAILGQGSIPQQVEAHNLYLLEKQESDAVHLVDSAGKTVPVRTPHYENVPGRSKKEFAPSLIRPEISRIIEAVCEGPDGKAINLEHFDPPLEPYDSIQTWDSKAELIYQILIINGVMRLGYPEGIVHHQINEVKKAEKIAEELIKRREAA